LGARPSCAAATSAEAPAPAAGKSELGIALAQALGGEVVNVDSMQLYRGIDVGTAKLTPAERHGVPHHLLDVGDVRQPATVVASQQLCRMVLDDLLARGVIPVLVGGSGLYLRAALARLESPGTNPPLRAELQAALAADGPGQLHARLAASTRKRPTDAAEQRPARRTRPQH